MNPFDVLKSLNLNDLKKQTEELSKNLKLIKETGEAGGGFVKVTLSGEFEILSIEYEDNQLIKEDLNTFKDLIIAAHNSASEKIKERIKSDVSSSVIPGFF